MKKLSSQSGVSLIEMLIYIAIVSVLALAFSNFALDVTGTSTKARVKQDVVQNARFGLERINQAIREANGVNTGSSTFGISPGVLSLSMDNAAVNPTVFDISGGVLRITEGVGSPEELTQSDLSVSSLIFTDLSVTGRTVNIKTSLTVEHPNPENIEIYDASITMDGAAAVREEED